MYASQASVSWWMWLLHVPMVLVGGYLIVTLTLAVIYLHFTKHYAEVKQEKRDVFSLGGEGFVIPLGNILPFEQVISGH